MHFEGTPMPRMLRNIALALVLILGVSTWSAPVAEAALSRTDFDREVVRLVNAERTKVNLPALKAVPTLRTGAVRWSSYMAKKNTFQHASHKKLAADNKAAGCSRSWAENIAYRSGSQSNTPKQVVQMYMNSPGHRAAILNKSYRFMASGTSIKGRTVYNTQRFAGTCATSKVSGWSTSQTVKVKKTASDVIKVSGAKRTVKLQQYKGKKWVTVKKYKTNSTGRVKVKFPKSSKVGKRSYRVVAYAKGNYVKTVSKKKVLRYVK